MCENKRSNFKYHTTKRKVKTPNFLSEIEIYLQFNTNIASFILYIKKKFMDQLFNLFLVRFEKR